MALLPCKSSAVVAGGGLLPLHNHLQVCVLNTLQTVDKWGVITCGWWRALFHLQLLAIMPFLLANEAEYTVSFAGVIVGAQYDIISLSVNV